MRKRLGIELLSVFGLEPVAHVELAADLGCGFISSGLTQLPFNPHLYEAWSLREDLALRRRLRETLRYRDVVIGLGEGFTVRPGADMAERGDDMDVMAELGVVCAGGSAIEPDIGRVKDQFAALAEVAGARGMQASIELVPGSAVGTLEAAMDVVRHVGRANFGLLLDSMHFFRSGGTLDELRAVDPAVIFYAQLCDVPMPAREPDYMREAMFNRLAPGQGDLPLADFVAALPKNVPIGLELPMLAQAEAGIGPRERLGVAVAVAQALL